MYDSWGQVISVTGSLKDTLGKDNPFRYRGYYYDEESGFYYIQSRYYDPVTCRFLNADSKINSSAGLVGTNVYAYCLNNPIRFVDLNGEYPGQLFDTMDEAAKDFANYINARSIRENIEFASVAYIRTHTFTVTHYSYKKIMGVSVPVPYTVTWHLRGWTYSDPIKGSETGISVPDAPPGQTRLGVLHSHGAFNPSIEKEFDGNDVFSQSDITIANSLGLPLYVITPIGWLRKYDPQTGTDQIIFSEEKFPSDPNHAITKFLQKSLKSLKK